MKHATKEDYLKAIYHLEKEGTVKSIEVAKYLEVSKPTVSEMLRKLADKGFIKFKAYQSLSLTKKGLKSAELITYKHRIIENFLKDILKIDKKLLHKEAHKLEHAFSNESIIKINSLLKNPKFCPHGKPIPKIKKDEIL